jgi:hypothetical protein
MFTNLLFTLAVFLLFFLSIEVGQLIGWMANQPSDLLLLAAGFLGIGWGFLTFSAGSWLQRHWQMHLRRSSTKPPTDTRTTTSS